MKPKSSIPEMKNKAREIVAKILYEMDIGGLDSEEGRQRIERKLGRDDIRKFAIRLFEATISNLEVIDDVLRQVVSNWNVDRLAAFDRSLLRMGSAEIIFLDDIPDKVSINEAIEIAKRFSTENSGRFINGVLDKVARLKGEIRNNL